MVTDLEYAKYRIEKLKKEIQNLKYENNSLRRQYGLARAEVVRLSNKFNKARKSVHFRR